MNTEFSKKEKILLTARNPKEYIDRSLKSNISPGRKAFITRRWLEKKRYTIEDIKYARNRHPFWKGKKMEGTAERNAARTIEHNYGTGKNILWDDDLILEFIEANKKDKNGNYLKRDWELAKEFKCTIPAIQHMRRKFNMAVKIITVSSGNITKKRLLDHLKYGESTLRKMKKKR
jgi:hypothetical protein